MTRYIIIGDGAVGAGLAAQLQDAGIDAVLVGRGAQIRHLAEHGLSYVHPAGTRTVRLSVAQTPDEVGLRADDVLVVATKSQHVEEVAREWAWRPIADGSGRGAAELPVLTIQNGLDSERALLRRFARVYGGSLLTPSRYTRRGEVVVGSSVVGVITLGRFPTGSDETAEAIAADLRAAGYAIQTTTDVRRWKAAKLLHSVKNGLEVFSGTDADRAALGERLAVEARTVFAAAGIEIADTEAERTEDLSGFRLDPASPIRPGQQSTWQSFARGSRSIEVDHLNGEIVLLGRLHGVPTPLNERVQQVLGTAAQLGVAPGSIALTVLDGELLSPEPVR